LAASFRTIMAKVMPGFIRRRRVPGSNTGGLSLD
jgi:hypothetical protein